MPVTSQLPSQITKIFYSFLACTCVPPTSKKVPPHMSISYTAKRRCLVNLWKNEVRIMNIYVFNMSSITNKLIIKKINYQDLMRNNSPSALLLKILYHSFRLNQLLVKSWICYPLIWTTACKIQAGGTACDNYELTKTHEDRIVVAPARGRKHGRPQNFFQGGKVDILHRKFYTEKTFV